MKSPFWRVVECAYKNVLVMLLVLVGMSIFYYSFQGVAWVVNKVKALIKKYRDFNEHK